MRIVSLTELRPAPTIVGSRDPHLQGYVRTKLEFLDQRGFDNAMVHIRYAALHRPVTRG
jgi:hypothetical protein